MNHEGRITETTAGTNIQADKRGVRVRLFVPGTLVILLTVAVVLLSGCVGRSVGEYPYEGESGLVPDAGSQAYWQCATSTPEPTSTPTCYEDLMTGEIISCTTPTPMPEPTPYIRYASAAEPFFPEMTVWIPMHVFGEPPAKDGPPSSLRITMHQPTSMRSEYGFVCNEYQFTLANYTRLTMTLDIPSHFLLADDAGNIYRPDPDSYALAGKEYPPPMLTLDAYRCAPADAPPAPGEIGCGGDNCVCKAFGQVEFSVPMCYPVSARNVRVVFLAPTGDHAAYADAGASMKVSLSYPIYFEQNGEWDCRQNDENCDCECKYHCVGDCDPPDCTYCEAREPWPTPAYPPVEPRQQYDNAAFPVLGNLHAIPVPSYVRITGGFGCNTYGLQVSYDICPTGRFHAGIDFAAPVGTPVYNVLDGSYLRFYGWDNSGYGNLVITAIGDDPNTHGVKVYYAHLSAFASPYPGEDYSPCFDPEYEMLNGYTPCPAMALVGKVGSTGNSTGPHLHWEVRVNNVPVNPMDFFSSLYPAPLVSVPSAPALSASASSSLFAQPVQAATLHTASLYEAYSESTDYLEGAAYSGGTLYPLTVTLRYTTTDGRWGIVGRGEAVGDMNDPPRISIYADDGKWGEGGWRSLGKSDAVSPVAVCTLSDGECAVNLPPGIYAMRFDGAVMMNGERYPIAPWGEANVKAMQLGEDGGENLVAPIAILHIAPGHRMLYTLVLDTAGTMSKAEPLLDHARSLADPPDPDDPLLAMELSAYVVNEMLGTPASEVSPSSASPASSSAASIIRSPTSTPAPPSTLPSSSPHVSIRERYSLWQIISAVLLIAFVLYALCDTERKQRTGRGKETGRELKDDANSEGDTSMRRREDNGHRNNGCED